MRLLTIARLSVWSSVAGSLTLFTAMQPEAQKILGFLKGVDFETVSGIWNAFSALLVGGGAVGLRQVIALDKRLNRRWHWVAKVMDIDGKNILQVSRGTTVISGIDDWKMRSQKPGEVIYGSVIETNGNEVANASFHATEISIARDSNLFYEWRYIDNKIVTGWTRLTWQPIERRRGIFRRSSIRLFGTFCVANSSGSGSIQFFYGEADAELEYKRSLPLVV